MKMILALTLLLSSQVWARWSVSSYNIRNFDHDYAAGRTNLKELASIIKTFRSDVMGFVEVVNVGAFERLIKKNLPGYRIVHSLCGGSGKQKLAFAYNPKVFEYDGHSEDLTFSGRSSTKCGNLRPVLLLKLKHKASRTSYVFGNAHLKAGGSASAMAQRWSQYDLLKKLANKYKASELILVGDFNTTGYNIQDEDFDHFENLLKSSGLETMSEDLACTSYWEGPFNNGLHQSSILDHILLEKKAISSVQSVNLGSHCAELDCRSATPADLGISYETVSDHCPIQVIFN